jgi:arylformamidase
VFIHGGYWQELTSSDSLFPSQSCLERGWGFAAIDHTLAPEASLDQIVGECCLAVSTLVAQAEALGFDASRLILTGSSAGAHLAAMVATNRGDTRTDIAGLVLVSGIFELEPLIGTSVNDRLGLDQEVSRRNSPLKLEVAGFPSTLIAYGADETSEFKAQSDAFAEHLAEAGTTVSLLEIAGRNHFDVVLELTQPKTPLGDAVGQLVQSLRHTTPGLQRLPELRPCQH